MSLDANVELTESVQSEGIVLQPFQIVTVNRTVWARKLSGAGTAPALPPQPVFVDPKLATVPDAKKFNAAVENLRTALANLGLKIIDDINAKRVHKPEEVYNALVAIYNAIK